MVLVAADVFGVMDTFGDLGFVIKVIAFAYLTYYLYIMFAENQAIFGLVVIGVGYFLMFHAPVIIAIALIVFFVVFGQVIQMNVQFGIQMPLEQMHQAQAMEQMDAIQNKINRGMQLSQAEAELWTQANQAQMQQQAGEEYQQQMMQRMRYGR